MVTYTEVLEFIRRHGTYSKQKTKRGKIISGKVIRRGDVVKFFTRRGHNDIVTTIKRLVLNTTLHQVEVDGELYLILPDRIIRFLDKIGKSKFTEMTDWKKLGREPVGDL